MEKVKLPNADELTDFGQMDTKEYNRIASAIIRKVRKRESVLWWPYQVSDPVRRELTSKRYITGPSEYDQREGGYLTNIDWSKKDLDMILNS